MLGLLHGAAAPPPRRFVLVGGVPGSGKTTLLHSVANRPGIRVIDPDADRAKFAAALPVWVPYRSYRALVHTLHYLRLLLAILRAGHEVLVVHDPATRPRRRELLARFARSRGWDPFLLYLDVTAEAALAGQRARGRVLDSASFTRHWTRWGTQRPDVAAARGSRYGLWARVDLVDREHAPLALRGLLAPGRTEDCVAG